ncbi:MAG: DUF11 domain-containing protein [Bacillota bacterium]
MSASDENLIQAAEISLSIKASHSPDPVKLGNELTYTLIVANAGPSAATDVTLVDFLPQEVVFISASSSQGSCSEVDGIVTCNLDTIEKDTTATVTIIVKPETTGTICNRAVISANETDTNPSNHTIMQCTTILQSICLETVKVFDSYFGKEEMNEVIQLPRYILGATIDYSIVDTKYNVVGVTPLDDQGNVEAKLAVNVTVDIKASYYKLFLENIRRVFTFTKTVQLFSPNGATIACKVEDMNLRCEPSKNAKIVSTLNFGLIAKSKQTIQIEVPYFNLSGPKPSEE